MEAHVHNSVDFVLGVNVFLCPRLLSSAAMLPIVNVFLELDVRFRDLDVRDLLHEGALAFSCLGVLALHK